MRRPWRVMALVLTLSGRNWGLSWETRWSLSKVLVSATVRVTTSWSGPGTRIARDGDRGRLIGDAGVGVGGGCHGHEHPLNSGTVVG